MHYNYYNYNYAVLYWLGFKRTTYTSCSHS